MIKEFTAQEKNRGNCRGCQCSKCGNHNCAMPCRAKIPCMAPVTKCLIFKQEDETMIKEKTIVAIRELVDASSIFASEWNSGMALACQSEANNPTIEGIQALIDFNNGSSWRANIRLNQAMQAIS